MNPRQLRTTIFGLNTPFGLNLKAPAAGFKTRSGEKRVSTDRRRGSALVEFSLVMPILLLIMTGMASFGLAMHDSLVLTNAVNIGAQAIAMSRGQTTDPCATGYSAIVNAAPGLASSNLSFTFAIGSGSYTTTSCTGGVSYMAQGATAQITASYPCVLAIYGMSFPACTLSTKTAELIQ